ncbi:MAG: thioredoxin family protein [Acidobacteria bacterium]|jgi:thioredoxin 1|nr:thioredoxin family protein [Acidobacteriota bacterium]
MMKKIICLLLVGFLTVSLHATCAADDGKNNNDTAKQEDNTAIKVTFIELGSVRCIPCKKMMPIIEEIKKEYAGQVKVVFYDVWTAEGAPFATQYKIKLIPTQVFLDKDGNEYFRHVGFFPKEELVEVLKQKGVQ